MSSAVSPATRSPGSHEMITRSGSRAAIASMLGSKALRSVTGASAGKLDSESTATTWSPAPMAKRISVEVGERLTMLTGRSEISAPATVIGKRSAEEGPTASVVDDVAVVAGAVVVATVLGAAVESVAMGGVIEVAAPEPQAAATRATESRSSRFLMDTSSE